MKCLECCPLWDDLMISIACWMLPLVSFDLQVVSKILIISQVVYGINTIWWLEKILFSCYHGVVFNYFPGQLPHECWSIFVPVFSPLGSYVLLLPDLSIVCFSDIQVAHIGLEPTLIPSLLFWKRWSLLEVGHSLYRTSAEWEGRLRHYGNRHVEDS